MVFDADLFVLIIPRGTLKQLQSSSEWGSHVSEIISNGVSHPRGGKDVGDHPPITPMRLASSSELDRDAWRLYDYIARHFIATVSFQLCLYIQTYPLIL